MENFFKEPFTFDKTARSLFFLLLIGFIIFVLKSLWSVLLPFLLAGIFAYVMLPFVKFIQHKLKVKSRSASVLIVFVIAISIIISTITILVPSVQEEVSKTMSVLSSYDTSGTVWDLLVPDNIKNTFGNINIINEIKHNLKVETVVDASKQILVQIENIANGAISIFSWGVVLFISMAYFIFILIDFEKLVNGFISILPITARPIAKLIIKDADMYMNSYFRGQGIIAISVAILLSIGFNIIGLPMATAIGIFIGVLNFIPYMQIFGMIPLGLLCILMSIQSNENVLWCIFLGYGIMALVQIIQDAIITPKVMGKKMGMRPSLILFSISVWGYLLGFFGMLVALPLTTIIYSIYMKYILKDRSFIEEQELLFKDNDSKRLRKRNSQKD